MDKNKITGEDKKYNSKGDALKFVVLLGIVSLFADTTYRGGNAASQAHISLFLEQMELS